MSAAPGSPVRHSWTNLATATSPYIAPGAVFLPGGAAGATLASHIRSFYSANDHAHGPTRPTAMSTPAADLYRRHRFTAEEYHRMGEAGLFGEDDRVELIEGEILEMTPIGSRHAGTVKRLIRLLSQAVGDQAIIAAQDPLRLGPRSEPEPDIALLRPRDDFYTTAHPTAADVLLVIEVAEASLRYDREVKIPLYARHGIPAVWLVDLTGRELTVHQQPADDGYLQTRVIKDLAAVELPGLSDLAVDLSTLF